MTGNLLTTRLATQRPTRNLDEFIENANRNQFVIDSGKYYFIAERIGPDGVVIRYGDRWA